MKNEDIGFTGTPGDTFIFKVVYHIILCFIIFDANMTDVNTNSTSSFLTSESDNISGIADNIVSSWQRSDLITAVLISFAILVCLLTILANMTIIILASRDKKLRKMNSFLVINLACMDLIVGMFVIPGMAVYNILGYWPLGIITCDIWTCVDFVTCTASFFNLYFISWDRFRAVTRPLEYRSQSHGKLRITAMVAAPWVAAMLAWIPAIIAWRVIHRQENNDSEGFEPMQCDYLTNKYYVLVSNIVIYVIPMFGIVYMYVSVHAAVGKQMRDLMELEDRTSRFDNKRLSSNVIYNEAQDIKRNKYKLRHKVVIHKRRGIFVVNDPNTSSDNGLIKDDPTDDINSSNGTSISNVIFGIQDNNVIPLSLYFVNEHTCRRTSNESSDQFSPREDDLDDDVQHMKPEQQQRGATVSGRQMERERLRKCHLARMMTHKRTTKTLGIIVAVFLTCWIPWTILYPLNGFCRCVPNWLYMACYWAAYLNSTFNPFLYGFNRDFRKAFRHIFVEHCLCKRN